MSTERTRETSSKVVAIDGPAASGKSSLCKAACQQQEGWYHVSTGILYRAFGFILLRNEVSLQDLHAVSHLLVKFVADLEWRFQEGTLYFQGENLTEYLSTNQVAKVASQIAELPQVRESLKPVQRSIVRDRPGVYLIDGRDIGTVIFPDADLKIFLTADLQVRARRRWEQLTRYEEEVGPLTADLGKPLRHRDLSSIMESLATRDYHDSHRNIAPLRKAEEAKLLDTSNLDFDQSVIALIHLIKLNLKNCPKG
jgi:cytidylate kinase